MPRLPKRWGEKTKDGRTRLSQHFYLDEFVAHGGTLDDISPELVRALERLRAIRGGAALQVISGYRTAAHNRLVGGAPGSQHLVGRAADIPAYYATVGEAERAGFVGIGSDGPWAVHVDVRSGPAARWRY